VRSEPGAAVLAHERVSPYVFFAIRTLNDLRLLISHFGHSSAFPVGTRLLTVRQLNAPACRGLAAPAWHDRDPEGTKVGAVPPEKVPVLRLDP
jgi:hypothetical protein